MAKKFETGQKVLYRFTYLFGDNPAITITHIMRGVVIERHKGSVHIRLTKGNGMTIDRWVHKSTLELEG